MTPSESTELLDRLLAARRPRWWLRAGLGGLALAGAAATAVLLVGLPAVEDELEVMAGARCVERREAELVVRPDCQEPVALALGADRITLQEDASIKREGAAALRLLRGRGRFEIARRRPEEGKLEVRVSHGIIGVLGTSFVVEQRAGGGEVELREGRIVFTWADGSGAQELSPGERLAWPRPAVTEPGPPEPERRSPDLSDRSPPPLDVHALMRRLLQLRSQRRFDEAATLLERALRRRDLTPKQQERVSFELGLLLSEHLGDERRACEHWREHLKRFPKSQSARQARGKLAGCAGRE